MNARDLPPEAGDSEIAVIGMAGRFPGARNVDALWDNLRAGRESITFFSDEELLAAGVDRRLLDRPTYVKTAPILDDVDRFDAAFFGYSPREARLMDPQHRLFLECAWEALEHAGYSSDRLRAPVGVYGGAAMNTYFLASGLLPHFLDEYLLTLTASDKDFLTTRISYKLNLTGPSITVQTACSTSLVAVHLACQSVLSGECDLALAGGVSVRVPHKTGYLFQDGSPFSPDGHCRAFDARARGTIFGSGLAIVVLKRLADALADRDSIYAVIKGSAVNNDGSTKVEYAAPSIDGQADVVVEALANAGIDARSVGYIEAHGTGTLIGDPIEVAALTRAFRESTPDRGFCAIGSIKTNIGHLDAAAGVAGLVKATLALHHREIPPSLHYERPNPAIDFPSTPFYVNDRQTTWERGAHPRRAGVSALGIGGTNAHVVLEEAPPVPASGPSRPYQLLVWSARTASALETATSRLTDSLASDPEVNLADVAYTLQVGRRRFPHRRMLVCSTREDALSCLSSRDLDRVATAHRSPGHRPIVFMLPGGGVQYPRMGLELYEMEPVFRQQVDRGFAILHRHVEYALRSLLFAEAGQEDHARRLLGRPSVQLPAIFIVEFALAALWRSWGIEPSALIGHSMGESTAACLAGVLSYEDALRLVVVRGQLVERVPAGGMVSVSAPPDALDGLLGEDLDLAGVNVPGTCIVSGPVKAIQRLGEALAARQIDARPIPIAAAGHSRLLDPILADFAAHLRAVQLSAPRIPIVSTLTGTWITPEQATDPDYWVQHLRRPVRFADGLGVLLADPDRVFLEVGPGQTLSGFARAHPDRPQDLVAVSSLRHPLHQQSDVAFVLSSLGQLWLAGAEIDWSAFATAERRRRVPLPTYPFEGERHWLEAPTGPGGSAPSASSARADGSRTQPWPPGWSVLARRGDGTGRRAGITWLRAGSRRLARLSPGPVGAWLSRAVSHAGRRQPNGHEDTRVRPFPGPEHGNSTGSAADETDDGRISAVEAALARLWREELAMAHVGRHDDFFALGGTSLQVTQLIARINETFALELSPLSLLESPTVAEFAECVENVLRTRQ